MTLSPRGAWTKSTRCAFFIFDRSRTSESHVQPLKCRSHGLRARCAAPESVRGHQNRTQMRRWRAEGSSAHRPRQCGNSVTPTTPTLHPQQHRRAVCDPLKIGPPHTQKKGRLRLFSSLRRFMVQPTPSNVSMDIRTTLKHLIN